MAQIADLDSPTTVVAHKLPKFYSIVNEKSSIFCQASIWTKSFIAKKLSKNGARADVLIRLIKRKMSKSGDKIPVDDKVRAALVATLYGSPFSFVLGAICGLGSSIFIALESRNALLYHVVVVFSIIVIARIFAVILFRHANSENATHTRNLEIIYEIGAWAYSVGLGTIAAITILDVVDPRLHLLAAVITSGYAASIAARNAGRPRIAIGQIILCSIPLALGLVLDGHPAYLALAIFLVFFVMALFAITKKTHSILYTSLDSAHRNEILAEEMRVFAITDPVTNLTNRAGLDSWLAQMFMQKKTPPFALFWLDLDRFKEVNDTMGHPVGDRVLAEVAKRVQAICNQDSFIARFGGDEFVIAVPDMTWQKADAFGKLIRTVISQTIVTNGQNIAISASIGIALYPQDSQTAAQLMQQADMALYASKIAGRNCQSFFQPTMDHELHRRRELESELRSSVRLGQLRLDFQPIVDLENGHISVMEALVRWDHPKRGKLKPDEFVSIAENTGMIITIGNWIILQACRAAVTWPDHIKVAVNISPIQMQAPGAALGFLNALKICGLPASRLELEITENVFADQTDHVLEFIRLIREAGIGLTLDDFGTGYSSLSYIRDFDFSKIKIDRSFVSGSTEGDRASEIIMAVANMAKRLKIPIVAEGIENIHDAQRVKYLGCTHGQGYYYGAGMSQDQAYKLFDLSDQTGGQYAA